MASSKNMLDVPKLIEVFFSDQLSFEKHFNFVLFVLNAYTYLSELLRSQIF